MNNIKPNELLTNRIVAQYITANNHDEKKANEKEVFDILSCLYNDFYRIYEKKDKLNLDDGNIGNNMSMNVLDLCCDLDKKANHENYKTDDICDTLDRIKLALRNDNLVRKSEMTKVGRHIDLVSDNVILKKTEENNKKSEDSWTYSEFWGKLAKDIGSIKKNLVEFYSKLMIKYVDFYQAYTKLHAEMGQCVTKGKDGSHVNFNKTKMQKAYSEFKSAINEINVDLKDVEVVKDWKKLTTTEQKQIREKFSPSFKIDENGKISIDQSVYNNHPELPSGNYPMGIPGFMDSVGSIDMASYNAWLASFNSMGNTFQSNMQSLSQRYTQVNSTFDNLNKVLSSAITALLECAKSFLH